MRQIVYALRFRGEAGRGGVDGNLFRIVSQVSTCVMRTSFDENGLHGQVWEEPGEKIRLESDLTITGATSYQEAGVISFGSAGDRLRFSTRGSGHLEPLMPGLGRQSAAVLQVDGGERRLADARGLIAATYVFDDDGTTFTLLHLGSIVLQDGPETGRR